MGRNSLVTASSSSYPSTPPRHSHRGSCASTTTFPTSTFPTYNTIIGQNCSFAYLAQPPSSTQQGCNPYDHQNIVRISLECFVRRHSTVNTNYFIEWFRENTDGLVQCLGLGDPVSQLSNTERSSRYHDNKFINQPYSTSLLGKYWCQVINTTADPDQPLMRSNVFTLLAPENYSGPTCIGLQPLVNITCADLSNQIETTLLHIHHRF